MDRESAATLVAEVALALGQLKEACVVALEEDPGGDVLRIGAAAIVAVRHGDGHTDVSVVSGEESVNLSGRTTAVARLVAILALHGRGGRWGG